MLSIGELCGKNVLHPESEETLTALQMREVRLGWTTRSYPSSVFWWPHTVEQEIQAESSIAQATLRWKLLLVPLPFHCMSCFIYLLLGHWLLECINKEMKKPLESTHILLVTTTISAFAITTAHMCWHLFVHMTNVCVCRLAAFLGICILWQQIVVKIGGGKYPFGFSCHFFQSFMMCDKELTKSA